MPANSPIHRLRHGVWLVDCKIPNTCLRIIGQWRHKSATILLKQKRLSHAYAEGPLQRHRKRRVTVADGISRSLVGPCRLVGVWAELVTQRMLQQMLRIRRPSNCLRHRTRSLGGNNFSMAFGARFIPHIGAARITPLSRPPPRLTNAVFRGLLIGKSGGMRCWRCLTAQFRNPDPEGNNQGACAEFERPIHAFTEPCPRFRNSVSRCLRPLSPHRTCHMPNSAAPG